MEENFDLLAQSRANYYTTGSPIQFVKVELLKNNQVIQTWEPGSDACDVTWADSDRSASDYYYVRVTQPDEHMAWSSPIWVDKE